MSDTFYQDKYIHMISYHSLDYRIKPVLRLQFQSMCNVLSFPTIGFKEIAM